MVAMAIVTAITQDLRMGIVFIQDRQFVFMWLRQEDILIKIIIIDIEIMVIKIGVIEVIVVTVEATDVDKTPLYDFTW